MRLLSRRLHYSVIMYGIPPVPFLDVTAVKEGGEVLSDFVGGGEPVRQCWVHLAGGRGRTRIGYGKAERGLAARSTKQF
jgi:hypothetical protein